MIHIFTNLTIHEYPLLCYEIETTFHHLMGFLHKFQVKVTRVHPAQQLRKGTLTRMPFTLDINFIRLFINLRQRFKKFLRNRLKQTFFITLTNVFATEKFFFF